MKVCTKCKVEKDLNEFSKCKSAKDGLQYMCKICLKQYYLRNKEKMNQYQKQYYQLNREEMNQYQQEYKQLNKEEIKAYKKQYRQLNREKIKAYKKQYRQLNREKINENKKQYCHRNPEKQKARYMLNYAVQSGKIHKPVFCSSCDSDKHLEAHHTDYSKPLEVTWLCRSCHVDLHRGLREELNNED